MITNTSVGLIMKILDMVLVSRVRVYTKIYGKKKIIIVLVYFLVDRKMSSNSKMRILMGSNMSTTVISVFKHSSLTTRLFEDITIG